jgi:poly(3-hydroxybutyrate) depolymerase
MLSLFFTGITASDLHAITYPPTSAFLYGNSSVNQAAQSTFVSGTGLPYRLLTPKNYNPSVKYPVIVFLHGQGEKGSDNELQLGGNANGATALVSTAGPDNQTDYPCFFVAPQAPVSGGWTNAAAPIQSILNTLNQYYSIDNDRVCLTGLSMGALSSWSIVASLPNTFSCLVPQSGGGGTEVTTMPKIPVWAFHAENDSTVVCNGMDNSVYSFRSRGFPVIYTRYTSGGHSIWPTAYQHPQLAAWIAAQRRGEAMQGLPSVTISSTTLAKSPLNLTGTTATNSGITVTRVGWCASSNGGSTAGTDGVTNGTTSFTSASANFTTAGVAGHRVSIRKSIAGTTSPFFYEIASVASTTSLVLDRTSSAETGRSYNLYKPGGYILVNPSVGTGSAGWDTWTVDVPMVTGTNIAHVFAEMTSGSASLGGRTSLNQPLTFTYATPSGDITAPALTITSPAAAGGTVFFPVIDIFGTASDAVGVTEITWSSDRGSSGTATGTTSWLASLVPLSRGMNTITLTAKDAKGNQFSRYIKVVYDNSITALQNWKNIRFGVNVTNPAIAGNTMDPDADGVANLTEYALDANPLGNESNVLPTASVSGDRLHLSFTRLAPTDVTYVVQSSTDLVTWTPIATLTAGTHAWTGTATVNETGTGNPRSVIVQDTDDLSSGTKRFLRLSITAP